MTEAADVPGQGWFQGREHRLPVRVYYEDTDFTGLVYHGSYVRFFERGRSDFLRAVGLGHSDLLDGEAPSAFVVAELALSFLKPARIDDALVVRTLYQEIRGPRLIIRQAIDRGDETLCRAEVIVVCIHLDGRPRRPTPRLVARVRPWLAPPSGEDG